MQQIIEMQENKIGETFEYEGRTLRVVEGDWDDCCECALRDDIEECMKRPCIPDCRLDGHVVHYEEVENG